MGLFKLFCSVLVLAVFADIALGQGYRGRERRPRCPPVCKIYCEYGNVLDSRGCQTCSCNPGPINPGPFPPIPTIPTPCPAGSVQDGSNTICQSFGFGSIINTQCRRGSFCSGGAADGPGRCCITYDIGTHPHCPVDKTITTCRVRINSCDSTRRCPNGYKCCPRGCGNRCVPAFGDLYTPMPRVPGLSAFA